MIEKKLAVLFPGIGYNFDRPLLHFAREQALQYGYEVLPVAYSGFPPKIRGDRAKMQESWRIARTQTEEILGDVSWLDYAHIVFVSKSIGTIVATQYAAEHEIAADQILFTPFPETFAPCTGRPCAGKRGNAVIAFHAQTDPWMDDQEVIDAAARAQVPMKLYPKGNHSLETGDALEDIRILEEVFNLTEKIFAGTDVPRTF